MYAEDPFRKFLPSIGPLATYKVMLGFQDADSLLSHLTSVNFRNLLSLSMNKELFVLTPVRYILYVYAYTISVDPAYDPSRCL